ncbi:MAG: head decoration protein [Caulobacteraceae bacterium]
MAQTPLTENLHDGGFLVSEDYGHRSRDKGVLTGAKFLAGTVMAQISLGAASSAVKASGANTGNGTFVLDATTPILAGAKVGLYTLRCIATAANGGTFRLRDPDGFVINDYVITGGAGGTVTVGDKIKGVLTDAATDFVLGDGFDVTIAAGSNKWVAFDPTGLDGRQNPRGFNLYTTDASAADKTSAMIVRAAEFNISEILWGSNVTTTPQKTAALAALTALGLIGR